MSSILNDVVKPWEKRDTRGRRLTLAERRSQWVQGCLASSPTVAAFARRERINDATFAGRVAEPSRGPGGMRPPECLWKGLDSDVTVGVSTRTAS